MAAPEEHHEDPEIGYLDDLRALEPLSRPFSDAELAKRRRISEEASLLIPDDVKFLLIMMAEGLA